MYIKNISITILLLIFLCAALNAQTADEIQTLLQTPAVSYAQAARFVLEAADVTDAYDKTGGQDIAQTAAQNAMRIAVEKKWLPQKANAQDAITLEKFSHLVMKAFCLKGGPMYTLFNSAHYSYREMVFQDLIQGRIDPHMKVSGEKMLFIVNRVLYRIEDDPWEFPHELTAEETRMEKIKKEENITLADQITAQIEAKGITDADVRITEEGVTISISNIQFLANSSELPEKERLMVAEIAQILSSIPGRKILVAGHTALAGTVQERNRTSQERAQIVANYLVLFGARKANEITVRGYGSEKPIAGNNTQEGMALNRRVEITLLEDAQ
jgi:outer membrane protein OmpA-like peptidoglycan-associated protein